MLQVTIELHKLSDYGDVAAPQGEGLHLIVRSLILAGYNLHAYVQVSLGSVMFHCG